MFLYTGGTTGSMNDLTADFITSGGLIKQRHQRQRPTGGQSDHLRLALRRRAHGTATLLPGDETLAIAINSQGDIGGDQYQPTGDYRVPIVYSGGTVYQLNAPHAGISSTILALNSSGQACGINRNGMCATVWTYAISGGSIASQSATDISPYLSAALTGYEASQAYAINDSGDVVGDWSTNSTARTKPNDRRTSSITRTPTRSPPCRSTFATQLGLGYLYDGAGESGLINDAGQVVGQITVDSVPHAAIWSAAGGLQDLNTLYAGVLPPGFVLNNATAIDNNGDIVGYGTDALDHTEQAFLLRTALPGDANLDGRVDVNDLTIVLTNFGQTG